MNAYVIFNTNAKRRNLLDFNLNKFTNNVANAVIFNDETDANECLKIIISKRKQNPKFFKVARIAKVVFSV